MMKWILASERTPTGKDFPIAFAKTNTFGELNYVSASFIEPIEEYELWLPLPDEVVL
jgi:hypothetical protein